MERLTERDDKNLLAKGVLLCAKTCVTGVDYCGSCPNFGRMIRRIFEYEETGLTPEQCAELAEADKEGRLVVRPCNGRGFKEG